MLIGKFKYIAEVARFDLSFAVTHLVKKTVAPNLAALQGLNRVAMYLTIHLHTPISTFAIICSYTSGYTTSPRPEK